MLDELGCVYTMKLKINDGKRKEEEKQKKFYHSRNKWHHRVVPTEKVEID